MVLLNSCSPPDEGIRKKQENTSAFVGERALGKGTLFIAERLLSNLNFDNDKWWYDIDYCVYTLVYFNNNNNNNNSLFKECYTVSYNTNLPWSQMQWNITNNLQNNQTNTNTHIQAYRWVSLGSKRDVGLPIFLYTWHMKIKFFCPENGKWGLAEHRNLQKNEKCLAHIH